jgi:hypothetical protein
MSATSTSSSTSAIGSGSSSVAAAAVDVDQPPQHQQPTVLHHRSALVAQPFVSRERRCSESKSSALALTANLFTDKIADVESQTRVRHIDGVAAADVTATAAAATARFIQDAIDQTPRTSSTSSSLKPLAYGHEATFADDDDDDDVVDRTTTEKTSNGNQQPSSSICSYRTNGHLTNKDDEVIERTMSSASLLDKKTQSSNCLRTLTDSYQSMLVAIGEDPTREGLLKTPERAALAMMYFTKGYEESVAGKSIYINRYLSTMFSQKRFVEEIPSKAPSKFPRKPIGEKFK